MQWLAEEMVLGHELIDAEHSAFFATLFQASSVNDSDFVPLFLQLNDHLIAHFSHEDNMMEVSGFSALAEHKGEHRRVLGEMNQFKKRVERGRIGMARSYVTETLPAWFKLHLLTMDSALVAQMAREK